MAKFIVKVPSQDDLKIMTENTKHVPIGVKHCGLEACNESVARANHRRGVIDGEYPKGSWVEVDETSDSQLQ